MEDSGVTLIELLVVVSVITVLAFALAFSYQGWQAGYNVENQIKQMYFDLMSARTGAMTRSRVHFVSLLTTQYTINDDVDPWPDGDGNLTANDTNNRPAGYTAPIPLIQNTLDTRYPITWSGGGAAPQLQFDQRGYSNVSIQICSNTKANADYNCIEVTGSRINIGKLTTKIPNGGMCNAANCIAK